jgi:hypothetical protein
MSERSGPQPAPAPGTPTVSLDNEPTPDKEPTLTEEPFEEATADDEKDWSDDDDLREDELSDDASNDEMSSIVPDHDRVEEIPEAGWANQPPPPLDFPEIAGRKRKESV